jgi:omega-6 fatty acid desaturase (delta-12 desaturase)
MARTNEAMPDPSRDSRAEPWQRVVARYQRPTLPKSGWQLASTLLPFGACWVSAYRLLDVSRLASLACCVLATGFLLRIYIIQHDCGHGSFFRNARANDVLGSMLGVITLLPYFRWRYDHAVHHAASSNLARRGTGDVWTMTVREYVAAGWRERLKYRLFRNPLVLFGLGPFFLFVVWQRCSYWTRPRCRKERLSVHGTNLALAIAVIVGCHAAGWRAFFAIHGSVTLMGSTIAVWLFYVQHQFEGTYWASPPEWDFRASALRGASWYRLPRVLQWFTGSIGIHHIHHLSPKIPNYELQRCLDENPMFQGATPVTLSSALRCASLRLWDEDRGRLVGWRELESREKAREKAIRRPVQP